MNDVLHQPSHHCNIATSQDDYKVLADLICNSGESPNQQADEPSWIEDRSPAEPEVIMTSRVEQDDDSSSHIDLSSELPGTGPSLLGLLESLERFSYTPEFLVTGTLTSHGRFQVSLHNHSGFGNETGAIVEFASA